MSNVLEKRVMDLIGEDSTTPDVYTDASGISEIRSHINDAIEEVAMLTGGFKRIWHIPLKQYAQFYKIPSSDYRAWFAWPTSIWLASNKTTLTQTSLIGMQQTDAWWLKGYGTPTFYAPIGVDKFAIYPAPSSSTDTLEVTGVAIPKRYENDTDRIDLREQFAWMVVNRAVSDWWATRGDARTAASYFATYVQQLGIPALYPDYSERRYGYKSKDA